MVQWSDFEMINAGQEKAISKHNKIKKEMMPKREDFYYEIPWMKGTYKQDGNNKC